MRRLAVAVAVSVLAGLVVAPTWSSAARTAPSRPDPPVKDDRLLSAGARSWFAGPPSPSPDGGRVRANPAFGTNVDANDPSQDLAAGQSETAVAAAGSNVVAAWNDVSGFLEGDSTLPQGSATGVGVSTDGGATFTDLIGLRNDDPNQGWFGDPTVVAVDDSHFIVGSLYLPSFFPPRPCNASFSLGVEVLTIGPGGTVSFSDPVVAAKGTRVCNRKQSFLDKELMAYQPATRTLAMTYTHFAFDPPAHCGNGEIRMVSATVPADPATLSSSDFSPPSVVAPEIGGDCSARFAYLQGSSPAVAPNGDIYVAYERNWISNLFSGLDPQIYIRAAWIPAGARAPAKDVVVTRGQVNATPNGGVKSLDTTQIVGYTRFIGNDFPDAAWDAATGHLVVTWNDASQHPLGDVYLKSLTANLGNNATAVIHKVNDDSSWALHFLPAVSVRDDGTICTSWYDRRNYGADSSKTDYFSECRVRIGLSPGDVAVTTGPTDWAGTGSLIDPNFGDYTDNATNGTTTYFIWSDGRIGVPQPFVDSRS